jgi:hypothetical protein
LDILIALAAHVTSAVQPTGMVGVKERVEMASKAVPFSGDQGVCAAVALGWQVAELFHSPVYEGSASDPRWVEHERLPGLSRFPGASQSKWLGEQIQSQVTTLLESPPQTVLDALARVLTALADPHRSPSITLEGIFTLHCRLLEALTVADFRLGKAYGLGRAIAETALLPAEIATDQAAEQQFRCVLDSGRLITIRDWLADLKTLLPDHTAYAVSRSLHDWQQWADRPHAGGDWAAAQPAIRVQGRFWRQLLTGEKAARDILKLSDYHAAGRRVAKRVITRFWWVIAAATLLIAGIIFVGSYLHNIPPSIRLIGDIAWLAGALGISLKGTGALLGTGLKDVEGWLWQIELDGSVAVAATYLPPGAKPSRVSSGSLGELSPAPRTGAPEQQNAVGHHIPRETVG